MFAEVHAVFIVCLQLDVASFFSFFSMATSFFHTLGTVLGRTVSDPLS